MLLLDIVHLLWVCKDKTSYTRIVMELGSAVYKNAVSTDDGEMFVVCTELLQIRVGVICFSNFPQTVILGIRWRSEKNNLEFFA